MIGRSAGEPAAIEEPGDGELLARVSRGDRDAAETLINRHQACVRGFLGRLCGQNSALADDLAQETFLRMLQYADRYDDKYPLRTWLLTIGRRLWINRGSRAEHKLRSAAEPATLPSNDKPAANAAANEQAALRTQLLGEAIAKLSDSQRLAVELFHTQECSIEETAEIMQMPANTVKSHLHRARATLRTLLEPNRQAVET